jgi:uncharacterized protein YkwD
MRLLAIIAVLVGPAIAAPAAAAAACPGADRAPDRLTLTEAVGAVECEINRRRRQHDLPVLDVHRRLREASEGHVRDMVRRGYFSHVGRDGRTVGDRARDAGYIRGDRRWRVGEVLAWGTFRRATPRRTVANWMDSPPHRRVLLEPRYKDLGVGAALRTPSSGDDPGATYAAVFGVRR